MQCAVCDAFIDEVYASCPYCGHISAAPDASAPPLVAAHDLPIIYANTSDDPPMFPDEQVRHAGLKRLMLFLLAAEMLIACIGLMTLPSARPSRNQPSGVSPAIHHHSGAADERIVVVTQPTPAPLPTAPVIAVAPAVVVVPHAQPHHVAPTLPPTRPTASPTVAPPPTILPTATATPAPPTSMPMPTPTATPPPVTTPTPTITTTPSPTSIPTSTSIPSTALPSPSPTPLPPEPTATTH